jgi:hypothetical protein
VKGGETKPEGQPRVGAEPSAEQVRPSDAHDRVGEPLVAGSGCLRMARKPTPWVRRVGSPTNRFLGDPKHQTLKTTPAVAAGIERHPWSLTQLAELLD